MTYRELVYMVLDELKLNSDDATYTPEHIIFIAKNYRTFLLKQRYSDIRKEIPESNYQTISLNMSNIATAISASCGKPYLLKSVKKIPNMMIVGLKNISSCGFFDSNIELVTKERMKFVGNNSFLQNQIYASINNGYLYMTSKNPQIQYLEKVTVTGIFEDCEEAEELSFECDNNNSNQKCDILDKTFPLEKALVPPVIELCVKELLGAIYRPEDPTNNANDDLANIHTYIRQHMKNEFEKSLTQ